MFSKFPSYTVFLISEFYAYECSAILSIHYSFNENRKKIKLTFPNLLT